MKLYNFILLFHFSISTCNVVNLVMLAGNEKLDTDRFAMHKSFKTAIENPYDIDNLGVVVSQSILSAIINKCSSDCKNIEEEYKLKNWMIFDIPNNTGQKYFLFIKKDNKNEFINTINFKKLTAITLNQIEKINEPVETRKTTSLLENLFIKNKESFDIINIFLNGHGISNENIWINPFKEPVITLNKNLKSSISNFVSSVKPKNVTSIYKKLTSLEKNKNELTEYINSLGINVNSNNVGDVYKFLEYKLFRKYIVVVYKKGNDIAGMSIYEFNKFLKFLNNNVNLDYLLIDTCHFGGINSIITYTDDIENLNKLDLNSEIFNFDIVSASSQEGSTYQDDMVSFLFSLLTHKEIPFDKLKEMLPSKFQRSKFLFDYFPMIRPKNQPKWFSLLKNIKSPDLSTFDLNKVVVYKYLAEKKALEFNQQIHNNITVNTDCVAIPINFNIPIMGGEKEKQFNLRQKNIFFKEISFKADMKDHPDLLTNLLYTTAYSFIGSLSTAEERQRPINFNKNVFIENLKISYTGLKPFTINNVYLYSDEYDKINIYFKFQHDKKFYETNFRPIFSLHTRSKIETKEIPSYLDEVKSIKKACEKIIDIHSVIKHLAI